MKKLILLISILQLCSQAVIAQSTNDITKKEDVLVQIIFSMQSDGGGFYNHGLFPSQRTHEILSYNKEDNNIFFTALIAMTLQEIMPYLSPKSQVLADSIISRALKNFPKYQNKEGFPIYNFWQTNPSRHFPNNAVLSMFKKFKLPEDFDDTSIIYMADEQDEKDFDWLKKEMIRHTNLYKFKIENTFDKYKEIPAYSTWFGLNMPIDFDICVWANTLSMVYEYEHQLNKYDSATLFVIKDMIKNKYYLSEPEYISPHYKESEIILYHLSRLIKNYNNDYFDDLKPALVKNIKGLLKENPSFMQAILLSSSMIKLGYCPPKDIDFNQLENDIGEYNFFVANMISTMSDPWKKWLGLANASSFPYQCIAYDYILILENIVLNKVMYCKGNN